MTIERRILIQAVAGASVTAAGASVLPDSAHAAAGRMAGRDGDGVAADAPVDPDDARFTLAVMPDTQYLFDQGGSDQEPARAALRHLLRRRQEDGIVFLAHLGDVTENYGSEIEFALADKTFRLVDRRLPYSVLAGNHDVNGSTDDQRGPTVFSRTFGPDRFRSDRSWVGSSAHGYNRAHRFEAGGRTWLVLALDWRVSDAGLAWAQRTLDAHPTWPTILTTHELVVGEGEGGAALTDHGRRLWDGLIRRNDQIFLAMGGHFWPPGRTVLANDAGHDVHLQITNYQDRYYGGAGMVRYYSFDMLRGVIDVETFSPWLREQERRGLTPLGAETEELSGDVDRFTLEIDFEKRFASFAPLPVPAPRPPSRALVRGTVAYWRFDRAGFSGDRTDGAPVAGDVVVRDLTGNGNDLRLLRLHDGPPEVLTWSADHARNQPGHASVRFDGGQSPDRGAVLRTSASAPLNSAKLLGGYTIETFVRLPDPFVGPHGFMGALSWEGRAGDAGKTGGYSPDDAVWSLNVSGERFLQNVVYPTNLDDDPTSWSHAIPVGRWTHVAIVNDGRHTRMYVDGSPIGRNAAQLSRGISTLGLPFALGATQGGGRYGQGFYGSIGDTRVVARALSPEQFLTNT